MGRFLKQVTVLFFLILFIIPSEAQQSCQDLFQDEVEPSELDLAAAAALERISQLRDEWFNLLSPYNQFPTVDVHILPQNVGVSAFHVGKGFIRLGVLNNQEELADVERVIAPIYAHEFGHAIFRENLVLLWHGQTIRYLNLVINSEEEIDKINQTPALRKLRQELTKIEALIKVAKSTKSPKELARLQQLNHQKTEELGVQVPNLFWFEKIHELTLAHNELFADSFAALFWKDPQIVMKALAPEDELEMIEQNLLYRGRNKDVEVSPRDFQLVDFKNWQKEPAHVYTLLDPARGVLWELYMKNLPHEEIPLFINVFLAATAQQFIQQIETMDSGEELNIVPDQYNREFLRLFMQEARKQGLDIRK